MQSKKYWWDGMPNISPSIQIEHRDSQGNLKPISITPSISIDKPMKTIVITLKDGHVYTAEQDSPIWNTVKVHEIESLEWKRGETYIPSFTFKPNPNYKKV